MRSSSRSASASKKQSLKDLMSEKGPWVLHLCLKMLSWTLPPFTDATGLGQQCSSTDRQIDRKKERKCIITNHVRRGLRNGPQRRGDLSEFVPKRQLPILSK